MKARPKRAVAKQQPGGPVLLIHLPVPCPVEGRKDSALTLACECEATTGSIRGRMDKTAKKSRLLICFSHAYSTIPTNKPTASCCKTLHVVQSLARATLRELGLISTPSHHVRSMNNPNLLQVALRFMHTLLYVKPYQHHSGRHLT